MTAVFDYKDFARDLTKQAEDNIPKDIALAHKKEFLDRIYSFTYIAGEAFSNDDNIQNSETKKMLTQVISEWTFHKYVDLLRSDIPEMYHENILQKLGYVAFEMTREAALGELSQPEMLNLVELQLKKSYEKACLNLFNNGCISKDVYENAIKLSHVDSVKYENVLNFKTFPYTVTALCFAIIVFLANVFYYEYVHLDIINTIAVVLLSMYIGFYIGVKKFSK